MARGIANALVIPFIAVATARNTGWTVEMHVSRDAVFHSTALLVSGVFLLAVAGAGYFVRYVGGDWGRALQIELLFGAVLFVVLVASSGRFRSRLKVFVSKHFFSYRYDYREEWLRFTRTLSTESAGTGRPGAGDHGARQPGREPGGNAVARTATEWLHAGGAVEHAAASTRSSPRDGSLASFLERTGWVVDRRANTPSEPDRYSGLVLPAWLAIDAGRVAHRSAGVRRRTCSGSSC